ncbi:hypothetical protein BWQ96_05869 [Gracilariopsis chorda]|uniref:HTH myb-type domain-containing protein n=1 Tax=Gracilariopsis chorda TaxID=448386 RepID=A0A2V3IQP7_9FLOR|nr:hypothetical protein BWQ96_05869 [Gracilariopsis chorda]|eukprot:PXF44426.1 hypothetical protein BWQ96_05869 [Gracilariopsis chorda]
MEVSQHSPLVPDPTAVVTATAHLRAHAEANATRIRQLESMIRSERRELARLLGTKRTRSSTPPPSQCTPSASPVSSPRTIDYVNHSPTREMAARGSHWSFAEKARFEAALHRYGPFAWDHIIRAVGTRSEKQVKAYAARYRRRKKLAAKAQQEAVRAFATAQLNAAAAAAAAAAAKQSFGLPVHTVQHKRRAEHKLAHIMPAGMRSAGGVSAQQSEPFNAFPMHMEAAVAPLLAPAEAPGKQEQTVVKTEDEAQSDASIQSEGDGMSTRTDGVSSAGADYALFDTQFAGGDFEDMLSIPMELDSSVGTDDVSVQCSLFDEDDSTWNAADRQGDDLLGDRLLGGAF